MSDIGGAGGDELPPLVAKLLAEADEAQIAAELSRFSASVQKRLRSAMAEVARAQEQAGKEQAKAARKGQKAVVDEVKKGSDAQVKARKAGLDRETSVFRAALEQQARLQRAHIQKMLQDNAAANAKRLEEQAQANRIALQNQRAADQLAKQQQEHRNKQVRNEERKQHHLELEDKKLADKLKLQEQKAADSREADARRAAGHQRLESERQVNRMALQAQRTADASWLVEQREAAAKRLQAQRHADSQILEETRRVNRERLEGLRQANRLELEETRQANRVATALLNENIRSRLQAQRSAERIREQEAKAAQQRQTAILNSSLKQDEIRTQAHEDRITARHKAMWSVIRTLTETGSRFMSSITQSGLRSVGNAVSVGLKRITGTYEHEGSRRTAAMREGFADQEALTRRAMVRQQGIVQGFQARNAAVVQGGAGGGPIGALMSVRNMLLGAGAFISARAIFGPVMDYQQTRIAFEGILQSSTAAENMLIQLQQFAKVTPFTFTGIADSAKQLLAVGYAAEDVIPMMTTLGNTAAGLGLGEDAISGVIRALGQMKGKGKASAEELQQISEQLPGFSAIEAISESMGITVAEAFDEMKKGAIPADVAIQAILDGMERMPGAAGAMERQSRTLAGRLSTLKDTVEILLIKAMDPFIGSISNAVGLFTTFLDNLFSAGGAFRVVRSAIMGLSIALGSLLAYQGVVLMLDGIRLALVGIAQHPAILTFVALTTAITVLVREVPVVNEAFSSLVDTLSDLGAVASDAFGSIVDGVRSTIGAIVDELAPSVAVMIRWFQKGEWVKGLQALGGIVADALRSVGERIVEFASTAGEFLRPFANLLVSAFEYAFWSVQVWLNSGGLGMLWDSIYASLGAVVERLRTWDWSKIVRPALVGLSAVIAYTIGGIPLLLGTALVAMSPRLRGGIMDMLAGVGQFIAEKLPPVLFNALHDAAEFITGPLLATILGPVGVRIIAGVAAALVAASWAISTGIVDGLKRSLPSIIDALQGLLSDILMAVGSALGDIPLLGDALAMAFAPLIVALNGIMPTLGLVVDIIRMIPTPVISATVAIYGLVKAWTLLGVTARAQGIARAFTGAMETIALRVMYAGDAISGLGTRLTNATGPAITNGAASRMQIAMGSIGIAAQGAGTAISAVGAALPMVAGVAAVALPVILGMWQSAQAAAKRHREEVNRNASAMLDLQTTSKEVLEKMVTDSDAATAALHALGMTVDDLFTGISGTPETVGRMFAAFESNGHTLASMLDDLGISMEDFGYAVLEGDQAVRDLAYGTEQGAGAGTDLYNAYKDIPDSLRDSADAMAETARNMLLQADATDKLTAAEKRRLDTILASEHPEAALIDLQSDVADRMDAARRAAELQDRAYQNLRDSIDEVANSTSMFNDVLDRLTGNALPLTRVRQNIEDALARFRAVMRDPDASPGEQARAFTDYSEAIRTSADDLLNLNRPLSEVLTAYRLQRREIIDQQTALLGSRDAAREYAERVLGLPPVAEMRAHFEDRDATNRIGRIQARMDNLVAHPYRPQVRMDLEQYHLQKVALEADLQGLSDTQIAIRVQMVGVVDAAWQAQIDRMADSADPAIAALGRQLQQNWIAQLPQMAEGGIVTKPTVALIGEAGPEAVVPLSKGMGSLPLSLTFDSSAIAGQVDAIAALLAPLGDRIIAAMQPGMDRWKASTETFLDGIATGFTTWGDRMVNMATDIGTAIAGALTSTLREGRQQVVGITRGYARSLVSALNPLLSGIGEEPITLNFARGGIAEAYQGAQVHVFNEGRRGRGSSHGEAYIPFDPANRNRSRSLTDETARRLGGEVHWYAQGGLSPDAIRRGQSFARAQAGKPYVWGGVGPNGFDCSGLASAIVNVIQNSPHPYARRFTSATLTSGGAVAGLIPGPGQVTIGARPGRPGHVTTNIAGLKAEATNGAVRVGPTAAAVSGFSSLWHLGSGVFIGADGTVYPIPRVPDAGSHGWLSSTARSAMRFVRRKARSWVDANTYTGSTSALESVMNGMQSGPASPELMATIRRAMSIAGVPSSWLGPLLTLISRESSYNPRAFNRTLGASGLMQTIPSTFARYALPGYGGIFDPLANVIAGLRYILDRYGSIFNVGQAVSPSPTRGYSYGGVVDRDGIYRLAEGNRREVVLPLENKGRLMELLRRTGLDETISLALGEYPTPTKGAGATTGGATPTIGSVIGEMHVHSNSMDPATVGRIAARRTADEVRSALAGVA